MIMKPEIEIKNVSKSFQKQRVLSNINANFVGGKIYGIVGRNGSGKSVLLKCICGLLHVTDGIVVVNGEIVGREVDFPKNIGFVIETPGFLSNYSAYKNLKYLAAIKNEIGKQEIQKYIYMVGLDPDDKKHVGKYSLGMKQRLGIAQAIMENPAILILDEPMNGLDQAGVEEMRKLFLELKEEGKLILLASHNRDDIDILCDEVYRIDAGIMERYR